MKNLTLILFIAIFTNCITLNAQRGKTKNKDKLDPSIVKYDGFFNFYYNEKQDKITLEIGKLDEEFLYVSALATGVGSNDIGLDRGQLGGERVVKFIKAGNKLLLVQLNYDFRATSDNSDERIAFEEAEHAAKFAELLGEVVVADTKANLAARVDAEYGATEGKLQLAKKAKELGLDAIHDTVHEMCKDEARHGKAFLGLLERHFTK